LGRMLQSPQATCLLPGVRRRSRLLRTPYLYNSSTCRRALPNASSALTSSFRYF